MTDYIVTAACQDTQTGAAFVRGQAFPSTDGDQIGRLTQASCIAPTDSPEGLAARADFEAREERQRQQAEQADLDREAAAQAERESAGEAEAGEPDA